MKWLNFNVDLLNKSIEHYPFSYEISKYTEFELFRYILKIETWKKGMQFKHVYYENQSNGMETKLNIEFDLTTTEYK